MKRINEIQQGKKDQLIAKSVMAYPDNPSERGVSARQLKKAFVSLIVDGDENNLVSEINRIVKETNASSEEIATAIEEIKGMLTAPSSMNTVQIRAIMWEGAAGDYRIRLTPLEHRLGATQNLIVSVKPLTLDGREYEEAYDSPAVDADGNIYLESFVKWEGIVLVCGGTAEMVDYKARESITSMVQVSETEPSERFLNQLWLQEIN